MRSYDVHRHVWPDALLDAFRARRSPPCYRDGVLSLDEGDFELDPAAYGVAACLADLERHGTDVAIVSCPPTLGVERLPPEEAAPLLDAYHEGMRETAAAARGCLLPLAMGTVADGFAGACLAADALVELDRVSALLDELERRRALLFVHPGPGRPRPGAPAWWAAAVEYTAQMQAAYATWLAYGCARWPELRVVFAILAGGAPFQLERLASRGVDTRVALHPTIYLDTASYGRRALELCLATYGASRLVFGSDAPVVDANVTLEAVRGFGQAVSDAVCCANPTALLS